MSRWADTFARLSGGSDTLDTMRHSEAPPSTVSQSVNSVTAAPAATATTASVPFATWGEAEAEEERAAIVEHAPDRGWWRDEYAERAAIRQYEGGYSRAEAELLAWRELENRWNLAHGERVLRELCAGCRRPIGTEAALDLIDGNRVHDPEDNDCLIRHGERWRATAARALIAMGLQPPAGA